MSKDKDFGSDMFDFAPETIKKEYFVIATIVLVLAVAIGYSFGADAGYKKGLEDGGHQPTNPISLTAP